MNLRGDPVLRAVHLADERGGDVCSRGR
jgi:hypothetical protein